MNEDELVAALRDLLGAPAGPVVFGIGDDAAAWRPSRSNLSVISTDALLEDTHFTREHFSPAQIGHRALASNLSDIAAMGARPVLATVALGVPRTLDLEGVLELYRGMNALARRFGVTIAGGDLVRSDKLMLSITVVGQVRASNIKRRDGARRNDVLAVTGPLGASRAGFDSLAHPGKLEPLLESTALAKHRTPEPRVAQGRWLAASQYVHALMDLSDGLSRDVPRMARASRLGARLEHIPVAPEARVMAEILAVDPVDYTCEAGEDFELLCAVAPRAFQHLAQRYERRFGHALYRIGTLHEGTGVTLRNGKGETPLTTAGWDHFSNERITG